MENKIEQQNNTNKSKTKEAISITIILVLAFALLGFGANLIRKQTPPRYQCNESHFIVDADGFCTWIFRECTFNYWIDAVTKISST